LSLILPLSGVIVIFNSYFQEKKKKSKQAFKKANKLHTICKANKLQISFGIWTVW